MKPRADDVQRDLFDELVGRPSDPSGKWDGAGELPRGVIPEMSRVPVGRPDPPTEPIKVRSTPIQRKYLEKYGFTEGCSKCRAIQRQDETQPTLAHNAACRARIEELLKKDPEFKDKIEAQESRKDRYVAQEVERGDQHKASAPEPAMPQPGPSQEGNVQEEDDIPEAEEAEEQGVVRGSGERPRGLSEDQPEEKKRREEDEKDEGEPGSKRARVMTVGVEKGVYQVLMSALEQTKRSVPTLRIRESQI